MGTSINGSDEKSIVVKLLSNINTLATDYSNNTPTVILINETRQIKELCDLLLQQLELRNYTI